MSSATVRLDPDQVEYELARRGLTARQLHDLTGLSEQTISCARNGRPISRDTLRLLGETIARQPVLTGAELLLREPAVEGTA